MPRDDQPRIVGLGARTPLGRSWAASAAAVRAGVLRFAPHPFHSDGSDRPVIVSRVPWLDDARSGAQRFAPLALPAARDALRGIGPTTLRVWLALPAPRPGLEATDPPIDERLRVALTEIGMRIADLVIHTDDHAAGMSALAEAHAAVQADGTALALVVGVDSFIDPDALEWIEARERLLGANNSWGFVPGEAAGAVLLASPRMPRDAAAVLGLLHAVALARETHLGSGQVNTGAGLISAVDECLATVPAGARISQRFCDLNGEPRRADEYGFLVTRIADRLEHPGEFCAPADCWGDVGAATAPLLIGLALAAAHRGHATGPLSLVTTSADSGLRGAAIVASEPRLRDVIL